jgi:gluconate 2-dehydrogenase alpha chain
VDDIDAEVTMARRLPRKDVVIIGLGWTGSIMANELTDEGLEVMAIERGPWRDAPTDFPPTYMQDELRYRVRHELFLRPDQLTFTFRNKMDQTALPIRSWGAFMPPNGVGGGGVHWNAEMWRFLPSDFVVRTHLTERYGAAFLPEDMTIQDWGISYDELEPFYDRFEYLCGTSGTAGNLRGQIMEGGNPFEGSRSRPYPTPRTSSAVQPRAVREGRARIGLQTIPATFGQSLSSLHEHARAEDGALHLLRLLRVIWLQQLLKGKSSDHDTSLSGTKAKFLRAR